MATSVGEAVINITANTSTLKPGIDQARQTVGRFSKDMKQASANAGQMNSGFNMARSGAAQLAVTMLGVHSATTSMATGFLMSFGLSAAPLLAITGGILAISYAFKKITGSAREAKKEAEALIDSLVERSKTPMEKAVEQYTTLNARIEELRGQLKKTQLGKDWATADGLNVINVVDHKKVTEIQGQIDRAMAALRQLDTTTNKSLMTEEQKQAISDAKARQKAIDGVIKALRDEQATLGMTAGELQAYRLKALGASEAEVKLAESIRGRLQAQKALQEIADRFENQFNGRPAMQQTHRRIPGIRGDLVGPGTRDPEEAVRYISQESEAAAKAWEQAWTSASHAVSGTVVQSFQLMFSEGAKLRDFLRDLLSSIANVIGNFGANALGNKLEGAISFAPKESVVSPSSAAGRGASTGGVNVHQNVSFNVGFVDGTSGEQWLRAQGGTIAGIVGQAAREAPGYARSIVSNGLRR